MSRDKAAIAVAGGIVLAVGWILFSAILAVAKTLAIVAFVASAALLVALLYRRFK
jgi:hypothetical protein